MYGELSREVCRDVITAEKIFAGITHQTAVGPVAFDTQGNAWSSMAIEELARQRARLLGAAPAALVAGGGKLWFGHPDRNRSQRSSCSSLGPIGWLRLSLGRRP
jgi:hypothetical protein